MRQSNLELLRILAVIGVFVLHFYHPNGGGGISLCESSINELILRILESIFISSVNIFVLITGYFMSQSSTGSITLIKPLSLIVQVVIYNLLTYLFLISIGVFEFSFGGFLYRLLPINWFVIIYVTLYCISPILNRVTCSISWKQYKKILIILLFFFSIYPTAVDAMILRFNNPFNGLSSIGLMGSQEGYTIVQFCLMYLIGGYLYRYPLKLSRSKLLIFILLCVCIICLWSYLDKPIVGALGSTAWEYCNPFVILEAVLIFSLFSKVTFYDSIINKLAISCFSFYLLHSMFYECLPIDRIVNANPLVMVIYILMIGVVIYFISHLVNFIYSKAMSPIFRSVQKLECFNKFSL